MNLKWGSSTQSISKSGEHNKSYVCQKINIVHVDTTYYKGEKKEMIPLLASQEGITKDTKNNFSDIIFKFFWSLICMSILPKYMSIHTMSVPSTNES